MKTKYRIAKLKLMLFALSALTAVGLLAGSTALARGAGAILGNPSGPEGATCFRENWGGVTNSCSATRTWVMPIIADNSGNSGPQVRARGVSGTAKRVCCKLYSVYSDGRVATRGSDQCTRLHTGDPEVLNSGVSIPGYGAYYAYCAMDPDTTLMNMHY